MNIEPLPREIRLIALDIDGTILDSQTRLPPRVAAAIERAAEAGYTLLPATGRQLDGIPKEVLALRGFRYVIASNGAKLYDLEADSVLLSDCFAKDDALAILGDALQVEALASVYMGGSGYAQKRSYAFLEGILSEKFLEYYRNTRIEVDDLPALVAESSDDIEKISLHFADSALRQATGLAFAKRRDLAVTSSARSNLEFNTPTASKGAALLHLAGHLGIERGGVMAVGNGLNDVAMLEKAGHAVAMGNSPDEVKAVADQIAPTNNEDGVAVLLETLIQ